MSPSESALAHEIGNDSSDSQLDELRHAHDDLEMLIEAAADVCTPANDRLKGLEASFMGGTEQVKPSTFYQANTKDFAR